VFNGNKSKSNGTKANLSKKRKTRTSKEPYVNNNP